GYTMLKIGIAGARGLSTMMGFEAIEGVKVTALCDLREDFLNAQAKQYNIPHTYRVFEDMVASDIDAVVIATPMQLHVLQALTALSATALTSITSTSRNCNRPTLCGVSATCSN
ncbi:MAG TPA: Gfo/Idh/MocA family oxidoreductase, partial [Lentisphaeria bacterium]|nr:Gfo/Idh/MocA family oxidoreductase [Lentisphaeria bacterium]